MALVVATPHPDLDIHALFSYYDAIYFDNALSSCFVEWSSPHWMSSPGTCKYLRGCCQITLSLPLLQCLSADHVKNTLLHEMIHAYLFVTKKLCHHDAHGSDFRLIMDSINSGTKVDDQRPPFGYKITLFHDFHDEDVLDASIAYFWMCKKCGNTIKRATATKPSYADCIIKAHHGKKTCGRTDCRWHKHKVACGGIYTNIQKHEEHQCQKKAVSNVTNNTGSIRLLEEESIEKIVPAKKCQTVTTSIKEDLFPSSAKASLSATSHIITYQRNLKGSSRSKLAPQGINVEADIQGQLIGWKSPEANMSDKNGKPGSDIEKEIMEVSLSSTNYHKMPMSRTRRNEIPQAKQEQFSPKTKESSITGKLGVQIDKKPDLRGYEKAKESKKKVKTEIQPTRNIRRFFPLKDNSPASSMKVVPKRNLEYSSPNMSESRRKRKLTNKESISQGSRYKVVSKWLEYYEDESTDEEIEPLVNRKTIRNKRMRILRESIQREKEEKEKCKEEAGRNLSCLPRFSQDDILDISDDDS